MEKSWQIEVENILHEHIQKIIDTNKGLTNKNYRVITENFDVIVRIPQTDSANIVYRKHEALAQRLIKQTKLDLETLYYNEETGMKITYYIEDLLNFNEYKGKDRIKRTAQLLRDLHQLNQCIGIEFNPVERYEKYRSNVKKPMIEDHIAFPIIQKIQTIKRPHTLCHNDIVAGNICFTPNKDYLIDYEYAGDNDPFFDVMSFITENELTQAEKDEFILDYFGRTPNSQEYELLKTYEQFHNLLWCTWATMMNESRKDDIYIQIAKAKYNALLSI